MLHFRPSKLRETRIQGLTCLQDLDALAKLVEHIRRSIPVTASVIEGTSRTRPSLARNNLRGIQLVDAAPKIWYAATEKNAPSGSDLTKDSPFANFLCDLLEICRIDGAPRFAFRARERQDRRPESCDWGDWKRGSDPYTAQKTCLRCVRLRSRRPANGNALVTNGCRDV